MSGYASLIDLDSPARYTKPLLFLSGGSFFESRADAQHLLGDQWGMMKRNGSYPGQVWLWLHTFWYQIAPFNIWRTPMRRSGC
jgi:hypothetical protein